MKKFFLILFAVALIFSCSSDDNTTIPQCTLPTTLQASNVTIAEATLTWESQNTNATYVIEYGISGFTLGSGTSTTSNNTSLSISGLTANTTYDFYVQAVCATNMSTFVGPISFTTPAPAIVPEFLPNLSQLNLFSGVLGDLILSPNVFEYKLVTPLYTDYAYKLRIMSLPSGTSMEYDGDGFPIYPNGTVMAKTFYYNYNELDLSEGRKIIETRVLIKQNNLWVLGNYVWNEAQTDAVLDIDAHVIPITWTNNLGVETSIDYEVPDAASCVTCHQNNNTIIPIGPQLRSMNFDVNGQNQLQSFINNGYLTNAPNPSTISALPDWEDTSLSDETRVRAYFDMNCAHCHEPGGYHNMNYFEAMDLRFETHFGDTGIFDYKDSITIRIQTSVDGYSMPFIGVTLPHQEALDLILPYLDSLE